LTDDWFDIDADVTAAVDHFHGSVELTGKVGSMLWPRGYKARWR
jgi:hypothetical protein